MMRDSLTLIAQGTITLDTLILYEVPIPDALRNALGKKKIIASLAFDPLVRRRRAEYLGVEMGMNLFRGKTPDESSPRIDPSHAMNGRRRPAHFERRINANSCPDRAWSRPARYSGASGRSPGQRTTTGTRTN
jgi:hypothetical protein